MNRIEQYDDDEGDRVVLTTDGDLSAAIQHARSAGWKVTTEHSFISLLLFLQPPSCGIPLIFGGCFSCSGSEAAYG